MEIKNSNSGSASSLPDEGLLSLAFDCTEMVTKLSKGCKLERQGDYESAMSLLKPSNAGLTCGWKK